jgi:enolase
MPVIQTIKAREILDCRGVPTIETSLWLDTGKEVTTSVPTSISTGKYEAKENRDQDMARYNGLGVLKAVNTINTEIGPRLKGLDPSQQGQIDALLIELDGTPDKSKYGANTILCLSQAVTKAGAAMYNMPVYKYLTYKYQLTGQTPVVPTPTFNIINGGKHGAGNLDFQEFLVYPSSRFPFSQGLQIGVEIFFELERQLINKNAIHSVGVEGGYAPNLFTNLDALEIIIQTINNTTHQYGHDVFLGLDIAASSFYKNGKYSIKDRSQGFNSHEFIDYYKDLNDDYHIFSLEDPLFEDDWTSWENLTTEIGSKVLVIGDDLISTNKERLKKAISQKACTAVIIKPNQVGTITETVEVVKIAKDANWTVMVSNRSGETSDNIIADFAVGVGAEYVKFGAPSRGERISKYNRLLAIESELNEARGTTPQKPPSGTP